MEQSTFRYDRRWDLVVLGILANLSLGTVYSWSVFREPLVMTFGFSTGQTGTPYSVFLAAFAFSMPLGGHVLHSWGPRITMAIGAVLVGIGWFTAGMVNTITALAVTYGLVGGIGVGLAYGVPLAVVGSWFPTRRGLALGLTLVGFGLSPFITAPLAELLIEHYGVSQAFQILGVSFVILLMTITVKMVTAPPWRDHAGTEEAAALGVVTAPRETGPRGMVRSSHFYGLWITFALGTFAGLTAIGMSAAYAIEVAGMQPAAAAISVAVFGVFNGVGRPLFGWLTDRLGPRQTAIAAFSAIVVGSAVAMMATGGDVVPYLIGFSLLWMLLGGWLAIAPTTTTHLFGTHHYAANYGIVYTAYGVGALSGGGASAYLTALTGSLVTTFWAIIVAAIAGIMVAAVLLPAKG